MPGTMFSTSDNSKIQTFCGTHSSLFVVWSDHVSSTHEGAVGVKSKVGAGYEKCSDCGSFNVYLQECHHNSVFITQKHSELVFRFVNSLLKKSENWVMKTRVENKSKQHSLHWSHHFWVMSYKNRVMGDGNTKIQTTLYNLINQYF